MTTLLAGSGRTDSRRINVGAIAGVAGFLIPTASNAIVPIWRMPSTSASGAHVAAYILDHQTAFRAVVLLDSIGVTLWMVFGGAVWLRLRRAAGADTLATSLFGVAFGRSGTALMENMFGMHAAGLRLIGGVGVVLPVSVVTVALLMLLSAALDSGHVARVPVRPVSTLNAPPPRIVQCENRNGLGVRVLSLAAMGISRMRIRHQDSDFDAHSTTPKMHYAS